MLFPITETGMSLNNRLFLYQFKGVKHQISPKLGVTIFNIFKAFPVTCPYFAFSWTYTGVPNDMKHL